MLHVTVRTDEELVHGVDDCHWMLQGVFVYWCTSNMFSLVQTAGEIICIDCLT